jgi:hypothetical protein
VFTVSELLVLPRRESCSRMHGSKAVAKEEHKGGVEAGLSADLRNPCNTLFAARLAEEARLANNKKPLLREKECRIRFKLMRQKHAGWFSDFLAPAH